MDQTMHDQSSKPEPSSRMHMWVGMVLVFLTVIAYRNVLQSYFSIYDDTLFVTDNPIVQKGLTLDGFIWAWTNVHASIWHPVTWISHMLDVEFFGLNPAGHHLTNLLLHIANTLLLFSFLVKWTRAFWQSALVAALFALHPLHVESVAWVAERKDLLSTFGGLAALLAYGRYIRHRTLAGYLFVVFWMIFSLMAKPMLVTFPFFLLLLDYWPLNRFAAIELQSFTAFGKRSYRLILEKLPLLLIVSAFSILAFWIQKSRGAMGSLTAFPLAARISNAVVSYCHYILKAFWPAKLSVFYPHPGSALSVWLILAAIVALVGITIGTVRLARGYPYGVVGWFWYLGTLVPVIGIVQVGIQGMADRYTYFPLTGLFIVIAWGTGDIVKKFSFPQKKAIVFCMASILLAALVIRTQDQTRYWQNSVTLLEHSLAVSGNNLPSRVNLGLLMLQSGKIDEAIFHYEKGLELDSENITLLYNLGVALLAKGEKGRAIECFDNAVRIYRGKNMIQNGYDPVIYATLRRLEQLSSEDKRTFQK